MRGAHLHHCIGLRGIRSNSYLCVARTAPVELEDAILVRARNLRSDAAALYSFFDKYARFITP